MIFKNVQRQVRPYELCVDMESTEAGVHVTAVPKRLVNGLCWNLNCLNPRLFAGSTECFGLLRNYSISSVLCDECRDR